MAKVKFYLWCAFLLVTLGPFFLIGLTLGQFIGTMIEGYKTGIEEINDISRKLKRRLKDGL